MAVLRRLAQFFLIATTILTRMNKIRLSEVHQIDLPIAFLSTSSSVFFVSDVCVLLHPGAV
jgi:hypothetical protein